MLVCLAAGCTAPQRPAVRPPEIDPARLASDVRWLADDAREGRGLGTRGLDEATEWLEARLHALGLGPAFARPTPGYRQSFDVVRGARRGEDAAFAIDGKTLAAGTDWEPFSFSDEGDATLELVFAGYGISAPELGWDDYAGLDVRGKAVLVLEHEPHEFDPTGPFRRPEALRYREVRTKATIAREHGAAAIVIVPDVHRHGGRGLPAAMHGGGMSAAGIVAVAASPAGLASAGIDVGALGRARDSGEPPGQRLGEARFEVTLVRQRVTAANVCGVVPGTDPERAREFVVVGAHFDHLGHGGEGSLAPDSEEVHNGADDNASGTAAVLAMAEAIAQAPLARTFVACLFGAEEVGLVGSAAFVASGAVPAERTVAMLNLDMVGRLRERRLFVGGVDTAKEWRALLEATNHDRFSLVLSDEGFGPSDHTSFHARGVPVLLFFTGAHADYHRPTDDADRVDIGGLVSIAAFATEVTRALGDGPRLTPGRPTRERPLPDFALRSYGASLGTVPEFAPSEQPGVVLAGVRAGSPAERAGLAAGDRIVRAGGIEVRDLYDLTYVLRSHRAGETIAIVFVRDGEERRVRATLEERPTR